MRYAVISDIHGNYDALLEVLDFLEQEKIAGIINCGDIVGYGPQPDECVDKVKSISDLESVCGNHDWAVTGQEGTFEFNPLADEAVKWTRAHISSANIDYLGRLRRKGYGENFMFTHGSPRNPLNEYIMSITQAIPNFEKIDRTVCFVGHTHSPACYRCNPQGITETVPFSPSRPVTIIKEFKYIINVGSVGQPRDGNPKACVCIYDSEKMVVIIKRIKYNITNTQKKIVSAGLPNFLATRLAMGI